MTTRESYPLPRDSTGRIITGPLFATGELDDTPPPAEEQAPEPILRTAPVGAAVEPPPPPRRRPGETPTPFGQLAPGARATPKSDRDWRQLAPGALALLLVAALIYAIGSRSTPTTPAVPAPTGAAASAAAAATAPPNPTARPTLARAVVAYDAPNGHAVGALEPGRGYDLTADRGDWRQLNAVGSGLVWVRSWEMDGLSPPEPTPLPTIAPTPPPPPAPANPAPVRVVPVGPPVTCVPVVDGDNGNAYLGDACGTTSEERQAKALELLQNAPRSTP
jgi:hypothetical protein